MDDETPLPADQVRTLRFLKTLVTVLTVTMIGGVVAVVALLVIRLQAPPPPPLPKAVALPDGARAAAFTQGDGWFAVVTTDDRILIFDRAGGALIQEVRIGDP